MKIRLSFFVWLVYWFFFVSPLQAEHKTLNIAQGYIAADILPLWVAKERNLFEKHGLATDIT
jgi:ABC-type nitrate/sulfonate/bicarbonate transport system substrate-binding protein